MNLSSIVRTPAESNVNSPVLQLGVKKWEMNIVWRWFCRFLRKNNDKQIVIQRFKNRTQVMNKFLNSISGHTDETIIVNAFLIGLYDLHIILNGQIASRKVMLR